MHFFFPIPCTDIKMDPPQLACKLWSELLIDERSCCHQPEARKRREKRREKKRIHLLPPRQHRRDMEPELQVDALWLAFVQAESAANHTVGGSRLLDSYW